MGKQLTEEQEAAQLRDELTNLRRFLRNAMDWCNAAQVNADKLMDRVRERQQAEAELPARMTRELAALGGLATEEVCFADEVRRGSR